VTTRPATEGTGPADDDQIEAAIARVRERVAARRRLGEYPDGMEDQLDRHYRELVAGLTTEHAQVKRLHDSVRQLDELPPFGRDRIQYSSRSPVGRVFHRAWGKLSSRQTEGILEQLRSFSAVSTRVADRMAEVVETLALHGHPDTERRIATLADRLALLEDVAARLDRIEGQLAELRAASDRSV
jgi:hypothetical protein